MSKRILLLTQWFDPEPTFKGLLFATELVRRGYEVEVVTGFPNYPGGLVYEGYKIKWIQKEIIDGVNVTRLPLYPSHDASPMRRILNFISFSISALFYNLFFLKKVDVIYAYHPPLTIGVVAVLTRFFRGFPVVYDIQDMWPDTLKVTGMLNNEKLLSFIGWMAKCIYKRVDKVVVLSPGFKKLLIERGVSKSKIDVIPNWCDESSLSSNSIPSDISIEQDGRLKIMFAGNMGKAQALSTVIDAARSLQEKSVDVVFYMIGGGIELERLKDIARKRFLLNMVFIPQVSMSEIGWYLRQADILLVHLKKDPLFRITIPSKIQAYMFLSKPILLGVEGDAANMVCNANAGALFEPENSESLVVAIQGMLEKGETGLKAYGEKSYKYYSDCLSLMSGVDKFVRIFEKIAKG
jgi:glycosyltransferase involved in cell wall biosynthesis